MICHDIDQSYARQLRLIYNDVGLFLPQENNGTFSQPHLNSSPLVSHICVNESASIGSDNGLSLYGANSSFTKMHLKVSSAKWRPSCPGGDELTCQHPTLHHCDVIMGDGVSNNQPHHCLFNRLFWLKSKETPKPALPVLCEGNTPVTGGFPSQRASNAETVSTAWRHHPLPRGHQDLNAHGHINSHPH